MKLHLVGRRVLHMIHVIINQFYFIPYVAWMLLFLPIYFFHPSFYWYIEYILHHWLLHIVASWPWAAGNTVEIVGEDIAPCLNDRALVLVNHQSTADVPMLCTAILRQGFVTPSTMWIMDKIFKFSNFGAIGMVHGNFFIPSGKEVRESGIVQLQQHLKTVLAAHKLKWIMLFPEGGFLRNRLASSQRYAEANNLPKLKHVSLPRLGAFHAILNALYTKNNHNEENSDKHNDSTTSPKSEEQSQWNQALKWVIDLTIGYENKWPLDLVQVFLRSRPPMKTTVHYRYFPIQEVPSDHKQLTSWLFDRWVEKEHMLDVFYKSGKFPRLPSPHKLWDSPQKIILNNKFLVGLNVFFLLSFAVHYWIFQNISYIF